MGEGLGSQWEEVYPLSPGYQCSGVSSELEIGPVGNVLHSYCCLGSQLLEVRLRELGQGSSSGHQPARCKSGAQGCLFPGLHDRFPNLRCCQQWCPQRGAFSRKPQEL